MHARRTADIGALSRVSQNLACGLFEMQPGASNGADDAKGSGEEGDQLGGRLNIPNGACQTSAMAEAQKAGRTLISEMEPAKQGGGKRRSDAPKRSRTTGDDDSDGAQQQQSTKRACAGVGGTSAGAPPPPRRATRARSQNSESLAW